MKIHWLRDEILALKPSMRTFIPLPWTRSDIAQIGHRNKLKLSIFAEYDKKLKEKIFDKKRKIFINQPILIGYTVKRH